MENTENDFVIDSMIDVLDELMGNDNADRVEAETDNECRMSVLTNHYKIHGAAGIINVF